MKVILATDGTYHGDAAAEMLQRIKLGKGDELLIVTVVDLSLPLAVDLYGSYLPDMTGLEKAARENASNVLDTTMEKLRSRFSSEMEIRGDILFGSPDSRIVETAEEIGADLIVMGSHGYKRWERLLLGSVSNSVVQHAHCSVLVVRTEDRNAGAD